MAENRLEVRVLGTSFTVRSDEAPAYLKRILWYLEKKIEETRKRTSIADPVKIAVLTNFYVIDELLREKSRGGHSGMLEGESDEMERIALRLISEIDDAIGED